MEDRIQRTDPPIDDLAKHIGWILLNCSHAEEAFKALVGDLALLDHRIAPLLTQQGLDALIRVANALMEQTSWIALRDEFAFAGKLAKKVAQNRNLFAHGILTLLPRSEDGDGSHVVVRISPANVLRPATMIALPALQKVAEQGVLATVYFTELSQALRLLEHGQLARLPERPDLPSEVPSFNPFDAAPPSMKGRHLNDVPGEIRDEHGNPYPGWLLQRKTRRWS